MYYDCQDVLVNCLSIPWMSRRMTSRSWLLRMRCEVQPQASDGTIRRILEDVGQLFGLPRLLTLLATLISVRICSPRLTSFLAFLSSGLQLPSVPMTMVNFPPPSF